MTDRLCPSCRQLGLDSTTDQTLRAFKDFLDPSYLLAFILSLPPTATTPNVMVLGKSTVAIGGPGHGRQTMVWSADLS